MKPQEESFDNTVALPPRIDFINYIVRDIHKSAELFSAILGVKHWQIREFPTANDEITVGEPNRQLYAYGTLGETVVELIQPLSGRSAWSEFLEEHGEGLHHIGYLVSDLDERVARLLELGGTILEAGRVWGRRWYCIRIVPSNIIVELEEDIERSNTVIF